MNGFEILSRGKVIETDPTPPGHLAIPWTRPPGHPPSYIRYWVDNISLGAIGRSNEHGETLQTGLVPNLHNASARSVSRHGSNASINQSRSPVAGSDLIPLGNDYSLQLKTADVHLKLNLACLPPVTTH